MSDDESTTLTNIPLHSPPNGNDSTNHSPRDENPVNVLESSKEDQMIAMLDWIKSLLTELCQQNSLNIKPKDKTKAADEGESDDEYEGESEYEYEGESDDEYEGESEYEYYYDNDDGKETVKKDKELLQVLHKLLDNQLIVCKTVKQYLEKH